MKTIVTKTLLAAVAAFALSACGEVAAVADKAADLQAKAGAVVEERAIADAVVSAVDVEAAKGLAEGAAKEALREALPIGEAAAIATVINEDALVNGLGRAVDTHALRGAVDSAIGSETQRPAPAAE